MDKPIHPYDSPENINNYLKKIKGLKLEKVNYRSLVEDLENKLGMIPFTGISIKKGTELYRARKNPAFNDKMFETINELTIREDSDILSFGRANLPNKAIFYCSLDQLTAAREVTQWQIDDMGTLIKKGVTFPNYNPFTQFMTISKWVTTKDMYFITLTDEESNLGNSMIQYAKSRYHFDSDRYQKSQRLVEVFFKSELEKPIINSQFDYYFSAYYSSKVYSIKQDYVAGLIYNSVAFDLEGYNFAIPRDKLGNLKFVCADFCYTYNSNGKPGFENHKIIVAPSSRATVDQNNRFIWKDVFGK